MDADPHSAVSELVGRVLARWPEHAGYVARSLGGRTPAVESVSEELARCILRIADADPAGLDGFCDDYRFLCEAIVLPEEIHFRRHGSYRLTAFADAERECYANAPFMARYMNGVLVSSVLWANHSAAFASFDRDFLPRVREGARHLEIGPGHGLLLYLAARHPRVGSVTGWDVSETSIAKTGAALATLDAPLSPKLRLQNMFDAPQEAERFDSVIISEVLEHLEDPLAALRAISAHMAPDGLLFVNVPANSPAPDHIFLYDNIEHAADQVRAAGFTVELEREFPMTGATLERARRKKLTTSCVVIARK